MGRHRSFDQDAVLTGAMHAFRRHGYDRTSVGELERATGLSVGSLYHAFRDKAGLRQAALDHYLDSFVVPRLAQHAGPGATLDDLERYFLSLFTEPLNDGAGCLITNTAVEVASAATTEGETVRRALDLFRRSFAEVLARELGAAAADREAARLLVLGQGILVLARAGLLDSAVEATVRAEFDRLRSLRRAPVDPKHSASPKRSTS